jgi:hypothetical protein
MNAKEKAKELIDKMWIYAIPNANGSWNNAKQSALICVDEILESLELIEELNSAFLSQYKNNNIDYWQEVKQEIEKL